MRPSSLPRGSGPDGANELQTQECWTGQSGAAGTWQLSNGHVSLTCHSEWCVKDRYDSTGSRAGDWESPLRSQ